MLLAARSIGRKLSAADRSVVCTCCGCLDKACPPPSCVPFCFCGAVETGRKFRSVIALVEKRLNAGVGIYAPGNALGGVCGGGKDMLLS